MRILKIAGLLALLIIALVFPQIFSDGEVTTIAFFTLMFAAIVTGWNILAGYTGYVALGHAAYFGIGAYALAIVVNHWNIPGGYEVFLFVPLAGVVGAVISLPLGWVALRVRRHTFIVITIAMFFIGQLLAYNLTGLTNGSIGLDLPIPLDWTGDSYNIPFYYAILALLIVSLLISWWIRNSKYGLGLLAIRDDEDRALGLGVKTGASKLSAFVVSAFIVAMAGAIWAYFVGSIYPASSFDPTFDVAMALMGFLGGIGTLAGPVLGAFLLEPTRQYFTIEYGQSGYYLIIYGALFLVILLLLPQGILPSLRAYWLKFRETRLQNTRSADVVISPLPEQSEPAVIKREGVNR